MRLSSFPDLGGGSAAFSLVDGMAVPYAAHERARTHLPTFRIVTGENGTT
jgi:hypothetical protein